MRLTAYGVLIAALYATGCCGSTATPIVVEAGDAAPEAGACGNRRQEPPEACDDGNTTPGDGCSADCLSDESCGNGVPDDLVGEMCDDRNRTGGDGCSADCRSDERCANGVIDTFVGEMCDDRNTFGGDGCSADCLSDETCSNGVVDTFVFEQCDDRNVTNGDGCSSTCRLEICGNGIPDPGEVCEDGNTMSGDGCSADCRSDERCGNSILDFAAAEVCDDGNTVAGDGCSADCRVVEGCGDGTIDGARGEQCDGGNVLSYDGCDPACHIEQYFVTSMLGLAAGSVACDVDGDGTPDNALGGSFSDFARDQVNTEIANGIANGSMILLFGFMGLDDPLGLNDARVRFAEFQGLDADVNPANNTLGGSSLWIDRMSLNPDGTPHSAVDASITSGVLIGGPEDIFVFLPTPSAYVPLLARRTRVLATTANDGTRVTRIDAGTLCGAIPARDLYQVANPTGFGGATALDVVATGILGGLVVATQPDLDFDGDGLETLVDTDGDGNIDLCTDGNGTTMVLGIGCPTDVRFADGYSATFEFTAVWAVIVGAWP